MCRRVARTMNTALLIDDDPFVRADLRGLLQAHPGLEVIGEAATVEAARRLLAQVTPGVVFLDVQLRGGSGFDLLGDLNSRTEVIFVTAFDTFAVRAFEVNALDYLVKPVSAARLAESLARLGSSPPSRMRRFEPSDCVFVRHDDGQRFVSPAEIAAVTSLGGNYSTLELREGTSLTVRCPLKEWERSLRATHCRIHRCSIVNLALVTRLERGDEGTLVLYVRDRAEPLLVSRRRAAAVRRLLVQRGATPMRES